MLNLFLAVISDNYNAANQKEDNLEFEMQLRRDKMINVLGRGNRRKKSSLKSLAHADDDSDVSPGRGCSLPPIKEKQKFVHLASMKKDVEANDPSSESQSSQHEEKDSQDFFVASGLSSSDSDSSSSSSSSDSESEHSS